MPRLTEKRCVSGSPSYQCRRATTAGLKRLHEQARTAVLVEVDGVTAGVIGIADTVKDTSRQGIQALKALGLK
ncbi:MAG: hypothetical protein U0670_16085 [Anaerolineae bacterium]